MTPPQRLNAWRAVVVTTLACDAIYAASGNAAAAVTATLALAGMIALLATTPPDAILLPRGRSERIISIGFVAVAAVATGGDSAKVAVAAALLVVGVALLAACRWRSISAWWTAVALWQPALLAAIRSW